MNNRTCAVLLIVSFMIPLNALAQSCPVPVATCAPAARIPEALALGLGQTPVLPNDTKADWQARYDRAAKMKRTGIGLFVGGLVILVGGFIWMFKSEMPNYSGTSDPLGSKIMLIGGLVGIATGIPLWAIGNHKMSNAEEGLKTTARIQPLLVLPLADHHAITLTARNGAALGYCLSW